MACLDAPQVRLRIPLDDVRIDQLNHCNTSQWDAQGNQTPRRFARHRLALVGMVF